MPLAGKAFLAIWHDMTPEGDDDFNRWHTREHMPERLGVPGFLTGRRYLAGGVGERYFNLYQGESLDVFASAAYRARLDDPTPWTRANLPHFRATVRGACRVAGSAGTGAGGALATVRFALADPAGGVDGAAAAGLARKLLDLDGVTGAHLGVAVRAVTDVETGERALRDGEQGFDAVLLVEGIGRRFLAVHMEALPRHVAAWTEPGSPVATGLYDLQYLLTIDGL